MNVPQRHIRPAPALRPDPITAAEVRSWFKSPGRLRAEQYETIAAELNTWQWPGDRPGQEDPNADVQPVNGEELPEHRGVARSVAILEAALPMLVRVLGDHEFMREEGDIERVQALQSALAAAKPAVERFWPAKTRGRPPLKFDLWPRNHWRGASRKLVRLFRHHLEQNSGDRQISLERNSVAVQAILAALKRLGFPCTDGLSASTLSQHLTKNIR